MRDHDSSSGSSSVLRRDWLTLALLLLSLSANVLLGMAVVRMSSTPVARPAAQNRPSGPPVGAAVPAFMAERLGGAAERIDFSEAGRPTLIYVFTPSCKWCARNLENVRTILKAAEPSHNVIALSLDPDVEEYVQTTDLRAPVYIRPAEDTARTFQFGATPQTLVISQDGRVLKSWVGAYGGSVKTEVEEYFGVTLPGLTADSVASAR